MNVACSLLLDLCHHQECLCPLLPLLLLALAHLPYLFNLRDKFAKRLHQVPSHSNLELSSSTVITMFLPCVSSLFLLPSDLLLTSNLRRRRRNERNFLNTLSRTNPNLLQLPQLPVLLQLPDPQMLPLLDLTHQSQLRVPLEVL